MKDQNKNRNQDIKKNQDQYYSSTSNSSNNNNIGTNLENHSQNNKSTSQESYPMNYSDTLNYPPYLINNFSYPPSVPSTVPNLPNVNFHPSFQLNNLQNLPTNNINNINFNLTNTLSTYEDPSLFPSSNSHILNLNPSQLQINPQNKSIQFFPPHSSPINPYILQNIQFQPEQAYQNQFYNQKLTQMQYNQIMVQPQTQTQSLNQTWNQSQTHIQAQTQAQIQTQTSNHLETSFQTNSQIQLPESITNWIYPNYLDDKATLDLKRTYTNELNYLDSIPNKKAKIELSDEGYSSISEEDDINKDEELDDENFNEDIENELEEEDETENNEAENNKKNNKKNKSKKPFSILKNFFKSANNKDFSILSINYLYKKKKIKKKKNLILLKFYNNKLPRLIMYNYCPYFPLMFRNFMNLNFNHKINDFIKQFFDINFEIVSQIVTLCPISLQSVKDVKLMRFNTENFMSLFYIQCCKFIDSLYTISDVKVEENSKNNLTYITFESNMKGTILYEVLPIPDNQISSFESSTNSLSPINNSRNSPLPFFSRSGSASPSNSSISSSTTNESFSDYRTHNEEQAIENEKEKDKVPLIDCTQIYSQSSYLLNEGYLLADKKLGFSIYRKLLNTPQEIDQTVKHLVVINQSKKVERIFTIQKIISPSPLNQSRKN